MTSSSTMMAKGSANDISFTQMMIPHHQQAVQMAEIALKNAKSSQVIALARQIKAAQRPEISMMKTWLKSWNAPVASSSHSSTHEMDMGSAMPGMMTDVQMKDLQSVRGEKFDSLWLQMMITHHQGAITEAKMALKATKNGEVRKLAQAVISGQSTEIATMKKLLAK
jgi:uncharacterized protein (DUF305 family)